MAELLTIGHGTLGSDAFARLLRDADVKLVVDVRAHPGSRRHPQFSRDAMQQWVPAAAACRYRWAPDLGGRRRPASSSRHTALTNASFRAYADYMDTSGFADALDRLVDDAQADLTAIMCAETLWWRCHRRLVADALVLTRSCGVHHLCHDGKVTAHVPMEVARVEDGSVVYDRG